MSSPPITSPTQAAAETMISQLCGTDPFGLDLNTAVAIPVEGVETPTDPVPKMPEYVPFKISKPMPSSPTEKLCEGETVATLKSWCEQLGTPVTRRQQGLDYAHVEIDEDVRDRHALLTHQLFFDQTTTCEVLDF